VSLNDLHLKSGEIKNDVSYDATEEGRITLPIIAVFLLILACFNYLNIAIVSGAKRLKEIGLRKVIGANRKLIIVQFFTEHLLLTSLAAIIGFVLAVTIFLPWFASFAPVTSKFNLLDPTMWGFLFIVLFSTAIFSGLYPAFYISRFNPVQIFRGSLKFGKKNILTKVFLTVQIALTCIGVVHAVTFSKNSTYQENRSWGYNKEQIIYEYIPDYSSFLALEKRLVEHPQVLALVGSSHHFSQSQKTTTVSLPEKQYEVKELAVGANYLETMGVKLIQGRFLMENGSSDKGNIIVNQRLVTSLELNEPVGKTLKIDKEPYEIVGVVEDAHFYSFYSEVSPTIFSVAEKNQYRYLSIQTNVNSQRKFTRVIAVLFVLLSSLGLYGLIQLNLAGRVKEFSIHKTLGASKRHIAVKVFRQYWVIFIVSVFIGAPAGYQLNYVLLDMMYPGSRAFGFSVSILAASILIAILVAVILSQVSRVIKTNPVDGLKTE